LSLGRLWKHVRDSKAAVTLQATPDLYLGRKYHYHPRTVFHILNMVIHLLHICDHSERSPFLLQEILFIS